MPRKSNNTEINEKIKYLGIDIKNINSVLSNKETKGYKLQKNLEENVFKQYKYVPVKDIQIFISKENKSQSIEKKFKNALPISEYLPSDEKDLEDCTFFLDMLKNMDIQKVNEIEEEQEKLNKSMPFKVKYYNNYLWKVYYSESNEKYFMVFTTDELDYSVLFYLIKKQCERKKTEKVFVPICTTEYLNNYMKKSDYENLKNYIWALTNDLPEIYDVWGKNEELVINVVGEVTVYEKLKSQYKIKICNRQDAVKVIKVFKYMYSLHSELPEHYRFIPKIDKEGSLYFCYNGKEMQYDELANFIKIELNIFDFKKEQLYHELREIEQKIEQKKQMIAQLDIEYLGKEKQISTYLECKKTLIGKFKYFFKNTKNKKTKKEEQTETDNINYDEPVFASRNISSFDYRDESEKEEKKSYTLENLIRIGKDYNEKEQRNNLLKRESNSLQVRIRNLNKKIQNANSYIEEIEKHKKSIFEFWKYCNKDAQRAITEADEDFNISENRRKPLEYEIELKEIGKILDEEQLDLFTQTESNYIYAAGTDLLGILNKMNNDKVTEEDFENSLNKLKKNKETSSVNGKNTYNILKLKDETTTKEYKTKLKQVLKTVQNLIPRIRLPEHVAAYQVAVKDKVNTNGYSMFSMKMEDEIVKIIDDISKNVIYRVNFKEGTNVLAYTNTIYSEYAKRTLPMGMDVNSAILVDMTDARLEEVSTTNFRIITSEKENGKIETKDFEVIEYDVIVE